MKGALTLIRLDKGQTTRLGNFASAEKLMGEIRRTDHLPVSAASAFHLPPVRGPAWPRGYRARCCCPSWRSCNDSSARPADNGREGGSDRYQKYEIYKNVYMWGFYLGHELLLEWIQYQDSKLTFWMKSFESYYFIKTTLYLTHETKCIHLSTLCLSIKLNNVWDVQP